jgi:hypothetical protein
MSDLDLLRDVLRRSTDLCRQGNHAEGLRFVETWIKRAEQEERTTWVEALNVIALAIAHSIGDPGLVRSYCERTLLREPQDRRGKALALYTLADVLFRRGETDLAKQHATQAYLLMDSNAPEDRRVVELLRKRWPRIADWRSS